MKPATREESIKIIKVMLRRRAKAKGIDPTDKWLTDKATEIYEANEREGGEQIQMLEEE